MSSVEITLDGGKIVSAHINGKIIKTDQSVKNGGGGAAPEPFELFQASIGTCAGIYVKTFCDQRGIPAEGIRIIQSMEFDPDKKVPSCFRLEIRLPADFPEKYRAAVVNAAELCLVKKTINSIPAFEVVSSRTER